MGEILARAASSLRSIPSLLCTGVQAIRRMYVYGSKNICKNCSKSCFKTLKISFSVSLLSFEYKLGVMKFLKCGTFPNSCIKNNLTSHSVTGRYLYVIHEL